jgi:hypothetical protein
MGYFVRKINSTYGGVRQRMVFSNWLGVVLFALAATVFVVGPASSNYLPVAGFAPNGSYGTQMAVSTTSSSEPLPTGTVIYIINVGSNVAYVNLGTSSSVTATTSNIPVPVGGGIALTVTNYTYIAAITVSGTATLNLIGGDGLGNMFGGSGGAVTANQGTAGSAAWPVQDSATETNTSVTATGASNTALNTSSGGPLAYAFSVSSTLARPSNTTTYTQYTGLSTSTSSATYLTFSNVCRLNGSAVLPTDLVVTDAANQTLPLTGTLYIFNSAPSSPIADNATFNISSTDLANLIAEIPFSPSIVTNQNSGASGSTMDHEKNLGMQLTCSSTSSSLYGMVEVTDPYVPVSGETYTFILKGIGAN